MTQSQLSLLRRPPLTKNRTGPVWLAALLILTACGSPSPEPPVATAASPASDSLLIRNVAIVDPKAASVSEPKDILLVGGSILEVAAGGTIDPTRAVEVLDSHGRYALPGLIDVHAHLGDGGVGEQTEEDRVGALAQFVRYGVTSIFVPGGGGGNDHQLARWKERCRSGELLCPDLFGSGALITAPGSHPLGTMWKMPKDVDPEVAYARGGVALAEDEPAGPLLDRKKAMGVDAIKIIIEDGIGPNVPTPRLSKQKVAELVEAGHERGLRVFAHVSIADHVVDAVETGADGIMHSPEDPLPEELLERMARQGSFYVTTFCLLDGFFDRTAGQVGEGDPFALAGVSERALESLRDFTRTPFDAEIAAEIQATIYSNLRRAAAAGVPLALGTDVNNPSVFPGYSAHEELALMVEAGLSPARALTAATVGSASFLEKSETLGRIAPGYEADVLILRGNPLDDILQTRSLEAVISDGQLIEDPVSRTAASSR